MHLALLQVLKSLLPPNPQVVCCLIANIIHELFVADSVKASETVDITEE